MQSNQLSIGLVQALVICQVGCSGEMPHSQTKSRVMTVEVVDI